MGDQSLFFSTENIEIKENLYREEIMVQILDGQSSQLRTNKVEFVMVLWRNKFVEEATWSF